MLSYFAVHAHLRGRIAGWLLSRLQCVTVATASRISGRLRVMSMQYLKICIFTYSAAEYIFKHGLTIHISLPDQMVAI